MAVDDSYNDSIEDRSSALDSNSDCSPIRGQNGIDNFGSQAAQVNDSSPLLNIKKLSEHSDNPKDKVLDDISDDSISDRSDALESDSEFDSKIAPSPDNSPLLVKKKSKFN